MRRRDLLLALSALPFAAAPVWANDQKKGGGKDFLQLPTLTAAIVRPDGRRGVLTVETGIDAANDAMRERVLLLEPRLLDAYDSTMMAVGRELRPAQAPDLDRLAQLLQADTDRIVGRPGARLLLGAVLVN